MFPKQHRILFVVAAVALRLVIYAVMLFKMYIVLSMPMAILLTIAQVGVMLFVWKLLGWNEPTATADATSDQPVSHAMTAALSSTVAAPQAAQIIAAQVPLAPPTLPHTTHPIAPSMVAAPTGELIVAPAFTRPAQTHVPAQVEPIQAPSAPSVVLSSPAPFAPTPRTIDSTVAAAELATALNDVVATSASTGTYARIVRPLPSWDAPSVPTFGARLTPSGDAADIDVDALTTA